VRLLFIAEGDAETRACWSGCAHGFVSGLRSLGAEVRTLDVELIGLRRLWVAARTFSPSRRRWAWRYRLGDQAFAHRSRGAEAALRHAGFPFDAIIQAGAPVALPAAARKGVPYIIYCDANVRFAERGIPYSGVTMLAPSLRDRIAQRERRVYDAADRIWSWSHALQESFRTDFEQDPARLRTIFAGANMDVAPLPAAPDGVAPDSPPAILFVGKDYARKGLDLLVAAFRKIQPRIPGATLHVVGGAPDWAAGPGVVLHGFVPASRPEGANLLARLYRESTVFCLPTRYEPFGVSFVEAMLAELPCVGTDRWAMPEIILDGETGWLVPDGDVDALARTLELALTQRDRSRAMGARGRERALELFTWERVAARALQDIEALSANARTGRGG